MSHVRKADQGLFETIKTNVATNQAWTERAVLAIFNLQTEDEKRQGDTVEHNGVGFSGSDAPVMTYLARWLGTGKHLSGKYLQTAQKIMPKYTGQLLEIAKLKGAS